MSKIGFVLGLIKVKLKGSIIVELKIIINKGVNL